MVQIEILAVPAVGMRAATVLVLFKQCLVGECVQLDQMMALTKASDTLLKQMLASSSASISCERLRGLLELRRG